MSVKKELFDRMPDGREVYAYTIKNENGAWVRLLEYGGIVQSVVIPDKNGVLGDVVCGFDSIADYQKSGDYHGALVGRYCNRIAGGKFTLNGKEYVLFNNEKGNGHLHGGNIGYNARMWYAEVLDESTVRFSLFSPDGEEGYPGNLVIHVTYSFDGFNLSIRYEAATDADTVCCLTNHTYFNLNGIGGSSLADQLLWINSDRYLEVDEKLIPVGDPVPVSKTLFDYTSPKKLATPIDHNFVLRGGVREKKRAAMVCDPVSGRALIVMTDLPGLQVYTAGGMNRPVPFKGGVPQRPLHAIALETQYYPDSPNRPDFPSPILRAGETFRSETTYSFGLMEE